MARGWESKDVESQIEERDQRKHSQPAELSAAEKQSAREFEDLNLSRTRVIADLEAAKNPGHREILRRSLQYLDEKIAELRKV